jgi:hypothetical protein
VGFILFFLKFIGGSSRGYVCFQNKAKVLKNGFFFTCITCLHHVHCAITAFVDRLAGAIETAEVLPDGLQLLLVLQNGSPEGCCVVDSSLN